MILTSPDAPTSLRRWLSPIPVKDGDHYIVNGSKTFIINGAPADHFTVAVRTGGEGHGGISLLLIDREADTAVPLDPNAG